MDDVSKGIKLFSLEDQVIVLTGATGGIGREIARGLSASGARVGLNARNAAELEALSAEIPESFILPFDITDEKESEAAFRDLQDRYGRLDTLICNAAARDRRPIAEINGQDYRALLDANLVAPFHLARMAAPAMIAAGRGRIIMVTSILGDFAMPGDAAYPSTKSGLAGLVRSLAVEFGAHGINVNGIAPGAVATPVNAHMAERPEWQAMIRRSVPLQRWADPSEMVGAAIFLASAASSYVNGQIITVDGGATVKVFQMD
ncbi:MAG: SDR family oxidoreductase [Pseudomonadota bacterium]